MSRPLPASKRLMASWAVSAGKSRAGQAFGQGRLKRQRNAGVHGKARQGGAQRAGGNVVGAGRGGVQLGWRGGQGKRAGDAGQDKAEQRAANRWFE